MISLDKVKAINEKSVNIISRTNDRWANAAREKGLGYKGLEWLIAEIPVDIYYECQDKGGKDFWTKNDSYNSKHYLENERDIKEWLKSEKSKHSILGR